MGPTPTAPMIYQLKVVLRDVTPMVWRRLLVASTTTIADLHAIIQVAMGWEDLHLHQFLIFGKSYGVYHDGGISFADNPYQVALADFRLRAGERFLYKYDFGDGWQHDIWLERVLPPTPAPPTPVCSAGAGNCPPEDCGGPVGYQGFLEDAADTLWEAQDDLLLVAKRLLAWAGSGPRPTENAGLVSPHAAVVEHRSVMQHPFVHRLRPAIFINDGHEDEEKGRQAGQVDDQGSLTGTVTEDQDDTAEAERPEGGGKQGKEPVLGIAPEPKKEQADSQAAHHDRTRKKGVHRGVSLVLAYSGRAVPD